MIFYNNLANFTYYQNQLYELIKILDAFTNDLCEIWESEEQTLLISALHQIKQEMYRNAQLCEYLAKQENH